MFITFRNGFQRPNLLVNFGLIFGKNYSTEFRQIPKCAYVLAPTQWLKNKFNFQRLKKIDKEFNEEEFKVGAKQAVLAILEIARSRDPAYLAKISTLRGFSRIYRDMIASQHDPRRKLLYFNPHDIQKVVPTDVQVIESKKKLHCVIEVFFIGIKYLDDVIKLHQKVNPNASLQIYQDIKSIEKTLKKKNYSDRTHIPLSEKLLVTEGYLHLYISYPQSQKDDGWKIDLFKISEFNFVHFKGG